MTEFSKIVETLDDVDIIHRIFPHLSHCNVVWMDIHDNEHVSLFGYDEDNFVNTYWAESVWPPIKYADYCDLINDVSEETPKNPVDLYRELEFYDDQYDH